MPREFKERETRPLVASKEGQKIFRKNLPEHLQEAVLALEYWGFNVGGFGVMPGGEYRFYVRKRPSEERRLNDLEGAIEALGNPDIILRTRADGSSAGWAVSVPWSLGKRDENEEIERALKELA